MTTEKKHNPLLDKVRMPGATFHLPSGAEFYADGQVELENPKKPEVYVSPMTTMDEISITSIDKLLNGTAVDEVFGRCIPAVKDPRGLLASDVDFLMVALRVVSFGKEADVEMTHTCEDAKLQKYVVNVEEEILEKSKPLTKASTKLYATNLSNGLHIKFTPLRYAGLLDVQSKLDRMQTLSDRRDRASTPEEKSSIADLITDAAYDYFLTLMSNAITSMDGIEDMDMIMEALEGMAIPLREEMLGAYNDLEEWGNPKTVKITCKDCKQIVDVKLDLNPVSFFTTRSRQKTPD